MIPDETPDLAPRDHNLPVGMLKLEDALDEFEKFFTVEAVQDKTFAERKTELVRAAKNAYVRDRESAGKAGDLLKIAERVRKRLVDARFDRSQPYRDVADALGRKFESLWDEVDTAMDGVRALLKTWTDAEDARIEQQRLEQEQEMAARLAPATPDHLPDVSKTAGETQEEPARIATASVSIPAKRKKIRGDLGATISAVEKHTYKVTDVRALPDYILNAPGVHEAIISAVKSTRKVLGVPEGVAVSTSTDNQIR